MRFNFEHDRLIVTDVNDSRAFSGTLLGGIIRDVFSMGARPIAVLNSLRFGELTSPRVKYLFEEVVAGIAGYGNCIGIPTVGGARHYFFKQVLHTR